MLTPPVSPCICDGQRSVYVTANDLRSIISPYVFGGCLRATYVLWRHVCLCLWSPILSQWSLNGRSMVAQRVFYAFNLSQSTAQKDFNPVCDISKIFLSSAPSISHITACTGTFQLGVSDKREFGDLCWVGHSKTMIIIRERTRNMGIILTTMTVQKW